MVTVKPVPTVDNGKDDVKHQPAELDFMSFSKNISLSSKAERFWWYRGASFFYNILQFAHYDAETTNTYMQFYRTHIIPRLGPAPTYHSGKAVGYPSFLTDDHSPIEVSVVHDNSGRDHVRFAIEPVAIVYGTRTQAQRSQFVRELAELPLFKRDVDLEWFDICNEGLTLNDGCEFPVGSTSLITGASQFFLGFECTGVDATMKAYYLPQNRALLSGVSRLDLVTNVIQKLGLEEQWNNVLDFFAKSSTSLNVEPTIHIIAVDVVPSAKSRIKVYVRIPHFDYALIEQYLTLGGTLRGEAVDEAWKMLKMFWKSLLNVDPTQPRNNADIPPSKNPSHLTSGPIFFYEMRPGCSQPYPKLYVPARHFARNDTEVALAVEKLQEKMGPTEPGYAEKIAKCFTHRPLSQRYGVFTYVTYAVRAKKSELTTYFSPENFAEEWDKIGV